MQITVDLFNILTNPMHLQVPVPLLAELEAVRAAARYVGPAPTARQSHPQLFGRGGKARYLFLKSGLYILSLSKRLVKLS